MSSNLLRQLVDQYAKKQFIINQAKLRANSILARFPKDLTRFTTPIIRINYSIGRNSLKTSPSRPPENISRDSPSIVKSSIDSEKKTRKMGLLDMANSRSRKQGLLSKISKQIDQPSKLKSSLISNNQAAKSSQLASNRIKIPSGFLSVNRASKSHTSNPKSYQTSRLQRIQNQHTNKKELIQRLSLLHKNTTQRSTQMSAQPALQTPMKFKKLERSEFSVEELFPITKYRSNSMFNTRKTEIRADDQLSNIVAESLARNQRVVYVIKRQKLQYLAKLVIFPLPFDMTEEQQRRQFNLFLKRAVAAFQSRKISELEETEYSTLERSRKLSFRSLRQGSLSKKPTFFLYDSYGSPILSLTDIKYSHTVLVLSRLPRLEKSSGDSHESLYRRLHAQMAIAYEASNLQDVIEKGFKRIKEREIFLEKYCGSSNIQFPQRDKKNREKSAEFKKIRTIYDRLEKIPPTHSDLDSPNPYFTLSPNKKDFQPQEAKLLSSRYTQLSPKKQKQLVVNNTNNPKFLERLEYQEALKKLQKKQSSKRNESHLITDCKFNRSQLISLKSIYDSMIILNMKFPNQRHKILNEEGVKKEVFIKSIVNFGFRQPEAILRDLLKKVEYLNWEKFKWVMQILIHKNADEQLNKYLERAEGVKSRLDYEEVLKTIKLAFQNLVVVKDQQFYNGYEQSFAKKLFQELGVPLDGEINVEDLKKFLAGSAESSLMFKYIFFG